MLEIILDTETTGLSPASNHRIVEIGCIELENQIPTKKIFHCFLNPERKVSKEAFNVHGYSDEFLKDKNFFSEVAEDFLKFINEKDLIIHNADFDLSHLNNELKIIGRDIIKKNRIIDTLELAREKFPGSAVNLDSLCKKFRINNSKRSKHSALIDCELLSKIYINLIGQKEPALDFSIKVDQKSKKNLTNNFINYSKKIISPSAVEIELHKIFLKGELKKNFF